MKECPVCNGTGEEVIFSDNYNEEKGVCIGEVHKVTCTNCDGKGGFTDLEIENYTKLNKVGQALTDAMVDNKVSLGMLARSAGIKASDVSKLRRTRDLPE